MAIAIVALLLLLVVAVVVVVVVVVLLLLLVVVTAVVEAPSAVGLGQGLGQPRAAPPSCGKKLRY